MHRCRLPELVLAPTFHAGITFAFTYLKNSLENGFIMTLQTQKLPDLIEAMTRPEFYPHPVAEPIHLKQTHISYVLLTGKYAYKIKKPVDFGFLDFTTIAKRKHFCERELELNRRYSPSLYLEVVTLTHSEAGYRLGGEGKAVEYAVKMREFPQEGLWSHCFEQGTLTREHMVALGKKMADIHKGARTNARIASYGSLSEVRAVAEENYLATRKFVGKGQTREQWEQTRLFSENLFSNHGDWLEERRRDGKIRECHGDLHLNNICFCRGEIHVFDCIEFNPAFRNIDVIYDVAFLAVDLASRDREDLAYVFLNTYLEHSGDYRGAGLLPLYCSMRAYIRAKVLSFMTEDEHISPVERKSIAGRAMAFYHLAWRYTQTRVKTVWVVIGLSGSGKTTVAAQLSMLTGSVHLRSDAVRKHAAGMPLFERGGKDLYTPDMTELTYTRMSDYALHLVRHGMCVVLDAKYDRLAYRSALVRSLSQEGVEMRWLECVAPPEVLRQRLGERKGDVSDATPDLLASQIKSQEPLTAEERAYAITLDTTTDWLPILSKIILSEG